MRKSVWLLLGVLVSVAAYAADAPGPDWAFMTPDANAPAPAAGSGAPPLSTAETGVPPIVTAGKGAEVLACNTCHAPSGMGQPESANLRGLNANYFARQMADFKSGDRSGPRAGAMAGFARNLTDDEVKEIAAYYAGLTPVAWTKIVEAATAPKTMVGRNSQRARLAGSETEPLGMRIVEFADSPAAIRQMAEPAFAAYAPPGSLAAGKALVEGSKTEACDGCHGEGLKGSDDIPRIAGRSPVYIARQLYSFRNGLRKGGFADVMKDIAGGLAEDDIVSVASYVASLNPS